MRYFIKKVPHFSFIIIFILKERILIMGKYLKLFKNHSEYEAFTSTKPNVSHCVQEAELHCSPRTWANEYLTFVAKADGTFKFSGNSVSYSLDNGETWTTLASNTNSPTVTAGNRIMWKATLSTTTNGIGKFSSTGQFDIEGNPMSLLFGDEFNGKISLSNKMCAFKNLFSGNTNVVNAKNLSLPATTLSLQCYQSMFSGCTSLVTAPQLPATALTSNCYDSMFMGCTSLTKAPQLPATTLSDSCYQGVFKNCTNLTTVQSILPATTLASNCYNSMFMGCTSLTTAPELPATTLTSNCYIQMFMGCTSLTKAPQLPATTLKTTCYTQMFYNCTNLNSITCLATDISATNCTTMWASGVSASGTFKKAASMSSWTSGVNGIPNGWTVQDA